MHESTLAKRYASALADLADQKGTLKQVEANLLLFMDVIGTTPDLQSLLTSPIASRVHQRQVVDTFLKKAKVETLTGNFLRLLVDKRRMVLVVEIIKAFGQIVRDRSGQITVQVSTPKPLTKAHEDRLTKSLSEASGKMVLLEVQNDPSLLGGVVVQIGSVMMDYSVRGQLNRLKAQMRG